jgi:hypothetical protein
VKYMNNLPVFQLSRDSVRPMISRLSKRDVWLELGLRLGVSGVGGGGVGVNKTLIEVLLLRRPYCGMRWLQSLDK